MPVDYQDYLDLKKKQAANKPQHVEYRTVETSTAWANFEAWLEAAITTQKQELAMHESALRQSGEYSHEGLIKHKVLVDIAQGQLRILEVVSQKVRAYHEETP